MSMTRSHEDVHCEMRTADEWNHLVPLDVESHRTFTTTTYKSAMSSFRRMTTFVQNRGCDIRDHYRVQYIQHGTVVAIKNTARRIGKALYEIMIAQERQFIAPCRDWSQHPNTIPSSTVSVVIPTKNA